MPQDYSEKAFRQYGGDVGQKLRILNMPIIYLLGSSLKKEADETLFLELALRGYDLTLLRDTDEKTAEIVKIS